MTIASRALFLFNKSLTTAITVTTTPKSKNWRNQFKQTQLVTQISSILLQRQKIQWPSLLKNLKLSSSQLTPSLFLQILHKTQNTNPQVSLHFFHYAKNNLGFQPDAKVLCTLVHVLLGSGLFKPAKPIMDSLIQTYPPTQILDFLIQSFKAADFHIQVSVLSSVLDCYCNKGLFFEALQVYRKAREYGYFISIDSCNTLLSLLYRKNESRLAWCYYGSIIRNGVQENVLTCSLIAQMLCKDGKFEKIIPIIDKGLCSPVMYNILIDCYSKRGNFEAAFGYLNDMYRKCIHPTFSTFSSILDGACKYQSAEVMDSVMSTMVEKGHIPKVLSADYNFVIQKLSDLGRTYAAELFFGEASEKKIELPDNTYGSMLGALSKEGRVDDAISMYNIILERKIFVSDKCYSAFMSVLCNENPSDEVSSLLKDLIGRGFTPPISHVSKFIVSQCEMRKWKEAEELLNVILQRGLQLESFCCRSLVRHYCFSRRIDSAISLHTELERLGVALDIETYGILLDRLFKSRRHEEAIRIFDYMGAHDMLSSESFSIMIRGLCQEKEFRKAMRLHDEMLKLGLKPDKKAYRRLISGFG
ncbi:pentatricopeptide repeat-containing protein At4g21170 [Nicotiana tomentosiformis]|uniref:pentatricopeptide repeat-containing protein At4g21170 n=1 Tax=Nicotiana tomentosiformis TaxID=4098 RepID=UPI00051B2E93|nr:pentatricopeptide repeat-containing protein At4g21170 [Nicotiana tomentosiformis]XP_018623252.1 pentatricopeptide repeat-containing protein At4g21170 [Nicotiana tomentosiformis]XP_018623253.1 pentatricopeptide repeat-containing protein At4g21170 [Nicotiana tomentosiformis]XP_018623255.1 pentatricopeptide repeat-containing protein At4g21170 [Nicotiana tomentosiformis]XP_018623256.1 pentatricopeptide repeat-containing protein At4g21170 [Nicotiana tomentosiformis]XP_033509562.1 pentatricopepti